MKKLLDFFTNTLAQKYSTGISVHWFLPALHKIKWNGACLHLNMYLLFGIIRIKYLYENFSILYRLRICVTSDMLILKQYHNFGNLLSILHLILIFLVMYLLIVCCIWFYECCVSTKWCLYLFVFDVFLVPLQFCLWVKASNVQVYW